MVGVVVALPKMARARSSTRRSWRQSTNSVGGSKRDRRSTRTGSSRSSTCRSQARRDLAGARAGSSNTNASTIASLLAHRSFRGILLAPDGRATFVVAPFAVMTADLRLPLLDDLAVRAAELATTLGDGAEYTSSACRSCGDYARVALRDIVLLVPVTLLVIALLLGVAFRRLYAVINPLAGVGLATICTLGLIQALGLPFDMVNSVSGVVILVVGVAEGAHIVARHRERSPPRTRRHGSVSPHRSHVARWVDDPRVLRHVRDHRGRLCIARDRPAPGDRRLRPGARGKA